MDLHEESLKLWRMYLRGEITKELLEEMVLELTGGKVGELEEIVELFDGREI